MMAQVTAASTIPMGEVGKEERIEPQIPALNPDDPLFGLTDEQVQKSLAEFGKNEIFIPETPLYVLFIRQFIGFLPLLIEVAALVSLGIGDYIDFGELGSNEMCILY